MIDFIKIQVIGINISELLQHPGLNFCGEVNPITGEMRARKQNNKKAIPYLNAFYKNLEFRVYDSGSVFISGSLHKYWNNGGHNYNDYNLIAVNEVLNDIKQQFRVTPEQMIIRQLELGVNFIPPHPTNELLQYCFLHGTTPFVWKHNSDEGKYIQAEHSQFIIKIYDKARHYRCKGFDVPHPEIMRFEIKYKKLEKLKKLGIRTVRDLMNYGLEKFVPVLVQEWQKVLFYDFTIDHQSKSLLKFSNPIYWNELKKRRSAFYKNKRQLNEIVKDHSKNIHSEIGNRIRAKGIQLTMESTQIDHLSIRSKCVPITTSERRFCIVTGINISMQRKNSKMLSISGLRYYQKTDSKIFNELKRRFLTDYWKTANAEKVISEIYHNIRNTINNQRIKQKRIYPENQFRLF